MNTDERLAALEARMKNVEFREKEDREMLQVHKDKAFSGLAEKVDDMRTKVYMGMGIAFAANLFFSKVMDTMK